MSHAHIGHHAHVRHRAHTVQRLHCWPRRGVRGPSTWKLGPRDIPGAPAHQRLCGRPVEEWRTPQAISEARRTCWGSWSRAAQGSQPRGMRREPRPGPWGPPAQPGLWLPNIKPRRQHPLLPSSHSQGRVPADSESRPRAVRPGRARRTGLPCNANATPRLPGPSRPRAVSLLQASLPGPP